jgi:hypothetical protein
MEVMGRAEFEAAMRRDGHAIDAITLPPGFSNPEHSHSFHRLGLIVDGAFTITRDDVPTTYRPGEVIDVSAGCRHSETVASGVTFIVARREVAGTGRRRVRPGAGHWRRGSLDHLVGAGEHCRRDGDAERVGGPDACYSGGRQAAAAGPGRGVRDRLPALL